jgi:hypothetical protein
MLLRIPSKRPIICLGDYFTLIFSKRNIMNVQKFLSSSLIVAALLIPHCFAFASVNGGDPPTYGQPTPLGPGDIEGYFDTILIIETDDQFFDFDIVAEAIIEGIVGSYLNQVGPPAHQPLLPTGFSYTYSLNMTYNPSSNMQRQCLLRN